MEMLKDLPSYNKANFSKFTQGGSKQPVKPYVRLKSDVPEERPRIIVTDNETLLHKELEMLALRTKRKSLKRTSHTRESCEWTKHPRIDSESGMPLERNDSGASYSSEGSDELMT